MKASLEIKKNEIVTYFESCSLPEQTYNKIIEIGQAKRNSNFNHKDDAYLVPGCQSQLWLHTKLKNEKLFFETHSDALISMGLAQLLVWYFSGEDAETILKSPPTFLDELGISNSLTPSRANGLYNIHLRMKQEALKTLIPST
ncbi:MAG: Cysteine desulfuration protein SufE [Chlamydiae bacterium]|nr:Cysteine desulfuration protein SufE [Chlamydiota bacterium]